MVRRGLLQGYKILCTVNPIVNSCLKRLEFGKGLEGFTYRLAISQYISSYSRLQEKRALLDDSSNHNCHRAFLLSHQLCLREFTSREIN